MEQEAPVFENQPARMTAPRRTGTTFNATAYLQGRKSDSEPPHSKTPGGHNADSESLASSCGVSASGQSNWQSSPQSFSAGYRECKMILWQKSLLCLDSGEPKQQSLAYELSAPDCCSLNP